MENTSTSPLPITKTISKSTKPWRDNIVGGVAVLRELNGVHWKYPATRREPNWVLSLLPVPRRRSKKMLLHCNVRGTTRPLSTFQSVFCLVRRRGLRIIRKRVNSMDSSEPLMTEWNREQGLKRSPSLEISHSSQMRWTQGRGCAQFLYQHFLSAEA